jgi:hypothetical protein
MLKNKIHRIPIVNESNQVVGQWIFWNCFADYVVLDLMMSSCVLYQLWIWLEISGAYPWSVQFWQATD